MKLTAIVPAIGDGRRQNGNRRWPYQDLGGRTVLARTLERLETCQRIDEIFLVVRLRDLAITKREILEPETFNKVAGVLVGGLLRQDYLFKALKHVGRRSELILVHDGNRPLVTNELLERTIAAAEIHGAAIAAVPIHDTVKVMTRDNFVKSSLERRRLRATQTPAVFRFDILMRAFESAMQENYYGGDEAALVERLGEKIKLVAGSRFNLYIASREDLELARILVGASR